jgi:hypothetical protein
MGELYVQMFLELGRDDLMKGNAKSIRSIQKIIENHPYTSFLRYSSLEIFNLFFNNLKT